MAYTHEELCCLPAGAQAGELGDTVSLCGGGAGVRTGADGGCEDGRTPCRSDDKRWLAGPIGQCLGAVLSCVSASRDGVSIHSATNSVLQV